MLEGQCLCGSVRYRSKSSPKGVTICHCGMCRRWHGAPGAYAASTAGDHQIEGDQHLRWYASSHDAERGFCALCGSKLFWREIGSPALDAAAGTLKQPTGLSTIAHVWVSHKGDYYAIENGAPCFAESTGGAKVEGDPHPQRAMEMNTHKARCLCGRIAFEIAGKIRNVVSCHCGQCLRSHGHVPAYTAAPWSSITPQNWDTLTWYQSSDSARRGFCNCCGSSLFWEPAHKRSVSISAGALESPTGLVTDCHIYVADKGDYYTLPDGMTLHQAGAPK